MTRLHVGVATAIGIAVLCALSIVRTTRPPSVVPASAPAAEFSAERAMTHVRAIAQRPHAIGTQDHDRVRDYITGQLQALGLRPTIQQTTGIGTRYREVGQVQNILARLPGTQPGRAVLVAAHYDGVEAGPAAADDAAGSAVLLETARALAAAGGARPTHDVIFLFTDGEEAGLIGAAAFAREHPWAKDVDVVLNFEARGTHGRSYMFETGPGNLDAIRVLRGTPHVTAGSVFTTIYRVLPNDTDLSELAVLGRPALNFAFADGVERYHTSRDDIAHLDPRSVQQHGTQALSLARAFAAGVLPRPFTGDAAFFDLPLIGLVYYPQTLSLPLGIIGLALVGWVGARVRQRDPRWLAGAVVGAAVTIVSVVAAAGIVMYAANIIAALHALLPWGGAPSWSAVYAAALAFLALAVTALCYHVARRFGEPHAVHLGAISVWGVLALAASVFAPGASYLFSWPVVFACIAALVPAERRVAAEIALWVAAAVTLLLLAGLAYTTAAIMLGLRGSGGLVLGGFTAMIAWLLAPLVERSTPSLRWRGAAWSFGLAVALCVIGVFAVRRSEARPAPSILAYAHDADSSGAWLATTVAAAGNPWTRHVMASGKVVDPRSWLTRIFGQPRRMMARPAPRVELPAPTATLLSDSINAGRRFVTLQVSAPPGTTSLFMRVVGAPVIASIIDGRPVDRTRFRQQGTDWTTEFWAMPSTGAVVALTLQAGGGMELELAARSPGLPELRGVVVPDRPYDVVPMQYGDVTIIRRRIKF